VITFDEGNLRRHSVTLQEADQVLDARNLTTRVFELSPARNGNERLMFVGFTQEGRLLEIGIEIISDEDEHVFHGMDATKQYRQGVADGQKKNKKD
jgi:uncharacterized DUF497 family protein